MAMAGLQPGPREPVLREKHGEKMDKGQSRLCERFQQKTEDQVGNKEWTDRDDSGQNAPLYPTKRMRKL